MGPLALVAGLALASAAITHEAEHGAQIAALREDLAALRAEVEVLKQVVGGGEGPLSPPPPPPRAKDEARALGDLVNLDGYSTCTCV